MAKPRVLVALATYNEIETLPSLIDEIERVLPDADVLVVDDDSPDGTGKWCDERAKTDTHLKCLHRSGKLGLGSASIDAMRLAIEGRYDVLVTMDADWSHDPQYLPALVATTEGADAVLGSRYCPGGAIEGWPLARRVLSGSVNRLSRLLLRLPVRDLSGAFRAYRIAALKKLDLTRVRSTGYSYLEEILWHLQKSGASLTEVPITFRDRRAGRSKISAGEAVAKLSTLARLCFRRK